MQIDEIVAMAVAAIAMERGTDVKNVKIISFKEIKKDTEETNEHLSH